MTWNTWAIDGDVNTSVKHPASVARMLTYAAFEGQDGIIDPTDMRVLALDVPGTAVRIMPGAAAVRNRGNGAPKEMYAVELNGTADEVQISPTDAGGGRSDLIVVRVENPFIPGESFNLPANPEEGPYTSVRVIEDVPASTTDYYDLTPGTYGSITVSDTDSVLTLARVDIPASTGAITDGYLTDLRSMGQMGGRRIGEDAFAEIIWTEASYHFAGSDYTFYSDSTSFTSWPAYADWDVPIPEWATGADVFVIFNPMLHDSDVWGEARLLIGGEPFGSNPTVYDLNHTGGNSRENILVSGTYVIPPEIRGTKTNVKLQFKSLDSGLTGKLVSKRGTYVYVQMAFKRRPSFV